MIPAYNQTVEIPEVVQESGASLEQQVKVLQEQVLQLRQTVEYLQREKSRLKSDVQTLAAALNRK